MFENCRAIVYKKETGKTVKEVPLTFYYTFGEEKPEERNFGILGLKKLLDVKLEKDEDIYLVIPTSVVLDNIRHVRKGDGLVSWETEEEKEEVTIGEDCL